MIDHISQQVPKRDIHSEEFTEFFALFGLKEIDKDEDSPKGEEIRTELERGWMVRWFIDENGTTFHIVGGERPQQLRLGHVGIFDIGTERWQACRHSKWFALESSVGNGLWLEGPCGLRVEVRP